VVNGQGQADAPADTSSAADAGQGLGEVGTVETPGSAPRKGVRPVRKTCYMNIHYHAGREAFLDSTHRWFMFAVILSGAAAFSDLVPAFRTWAPAVAALIGALDLTFDLSNRARSHALFRRRYCEVLGDFEAGHIDADKAKAKLSAIEAEEEPVYLAALMISNNRAERQVYDEHELTLIDVPVGHRLFQNLWRFDDHDYKDVPRPSAA